MERHTADSLFARALRITKLAPSIVLVFVVLVFVLNLGFFIKTACTGKRNPHHNTPVTQTLQAWQQPLPPTPAHVPTVPVAAHTTPPPAPGAHHSAPQAAPAPAHSAPRQALLPGIAPPPLTVPRYLPYILHYCPCSVLHSLPCLLVGLQGPVWVCHTRWVYHTGNCYRVAGAHGAMRLQQQSSPVLEPCSEAIPCSHHHPS